MGYLFCLQKCAFIGPEVEILIRASGTFLKRRSKRPLPYLLKTNVIINAVKSLWLCYGFWRPFGASANLSSGPHVNLFWRAFNLKSEKRTAVAN